MGGAAKRNAGFTGNRRYRRAAGRGLRRYGIRVAAAAVLVTFVSGAPTVAAGRLASDTWPSLKAQASLASSPTSTRLRVKVDEAADFRAAYPAESLNATVTQPPGFLASYMWVGIGIIAMLILAVLAVLWRRVILRRRDVRGLTAILRRNGEQLGRELPAPNRYSDTFHFIIRDEAEPAARLDFPRPGFPAYRVKRSGIGEVKLMAPADGEMYVLVIGGPGEPVGHNGLELAFRDTRRLRSAGGARVDGRSSYGHSPTPRPASSASTPQSSDPSATTAPSAPTKDEWL